MKLFLPEASLDEYLKISARHSIDPFSPKPNSKDIRDQLHANIRAALCDPKAEWPVEAIFRLWKIVETAVHLGKAQSSQWLLLGEIRDALTIHHDDQDLSKQPLKCRPICSNEDVWTTALVAAASGLSQTKYRSKVSIGSRESVLATSLDALRRKGIETKIDGLGGGLTTKGYQRVCARIEKKIQSCGGLFTANALLQLMSNRGRIHDGSFLHARSPKMVSQASEPGTPWHYIYNLGLKHLAVSPKKANPGIVLEAMEPLARQMASALDVEPHSAYENLSFGGPEFVGFLFETVLYDELFSFPQWQPLAAEFLIPEWLACLEQEGCISPVLDRSSWVAFAEKLISATNKNSLTYLTARELASSGLSVRDSQKLLLSLSQAASKANKNYRTPSDTGVRDCTFYPVLRLEGGKFVAHPRSVSARAFCERHASLMRKDAKDDADFENKLGRALEKLTAATLEKFGSKPSQTNAKYPGEKRGEVSEIDIVVETDDRIYLVECTKKSLTSRSRGGHTMPVLADLEASFFKLTEQLARHEARLKRDKKIEFLNGSVLELNDRQIEKIGVNLFDHGSLQSRDATIPLIKLLAGAQMTHHGSEDEKTLVKVNKRLASIGNSLRTIQKHSEKPDFVLHNFSMSMWWLSIDQLYFLCDSGGGLWDGLRLIRHMTNHTGDLVAEVKSALRLKRAGTAML